MSKRKTQLKHQKLSIIKKAIFIYLLYLLLSITFFNLILSQEPNEEPNLNNLELIFVYQHIRHGARGPSTSYNSLFKDGFDEFRVSWEGEGDGELTLIGMREHYNIGVRNRLKYGKTEDGLGLIDFNQYDPSEVLFHVTDYNRTHMSINSELLGMYQPGILKNMTQKQVKNSYPPNSKIWKKKSKENIKLYQKIMKEIEDLGNRTTINSIPIFNVHTFDSNRIFNLENTCNNIEKIRANNIANKTELLYGYFLNKSEILKNFFNFSDYSYFTNIRMMNSIADHYISDYFNYKDLSIFNRITKIDLDEFMNASTKFYYDWMYNYYCTNETCPMESSRLMEDLLGYMEGRIALGENKKSYKAPKMVIDCGHDTTVAPMQMFMKVTWADFPKYGINTQYCGFSCNLYFELYKTIDSDTKYYVLYYMDDELINIFEYKEFEKEVRKHIFSQDQIKEYCLAQEETDNNLVSGGKSIPTGKEETFTESFKNHTTLWLGFFTACFTTLIGIISVIILVMKLRKSRNSIDYKPIPKMQELTTNLITQSDTKV